MWRWAFHLKNGAITSTFCNVYMLPDFYFFNVKKKLKNFFRTLTHERLRQQKKKFMTSFRMVVACLMMIRRALIEWDWRMTSSALHERLWIYVNLFVNLWRNELYSSAINSSFRRCSLMCILRLLRMVKLEIFSTRAIKKSVVGLWLLSQVEN